MAPKLARGARVAVCLGLVAGTAQCSFSSLEGFSGGAADAGAADASSDVIVNETSVDADAEAAVDTDSGIDATPGAATLVQKVAASYVVAPSHSAQLGSAVGAGHFLLAMVVSNHLSATATFAVSDSLKHTWKSTPHQRCTLSNIGASLWYVESTIAGIDAVTVTQSPAPPADAGGASGYELELAVFEYDGVVNANALDVEDGRCTSNATTAMSAPSVTTKANDLVVAVFGDPCGTGTMTPGPGFTADDVYPPYFTLMED